MNKLKHKINAFGLVEVLVALAIFGIAFIAATAVTISSLRTIKDNEIADFTNSLMVRTLEYSKSDAVDYNTLTTGTLPRAFVVNGDVATNTNISFSPASDNNKLTADACAGSEYVLNISDPDFQNLEICNQIYVQYTTPAQNNLLITSVTVYTRGDNSKLVSELRGFRTAPP